MLDDENVLKQRDPSGALGVAADQWQQTTFDTHIGHSDHDGREITSVVVAGMGGSALAALLVKTWLKKELTIPFEVVRNYSLPGYVNENTLVIASSYSGNTEETLSALAEAEKKGAQLAIIASGGKLIEIAGEKEIAHVHAEVTLPSGLQPRMAVLYNLRGLVSLLAQFGVVDWNKLDEIASLSDWLHAESEKWLSTVTTDQNYAKQIALLAVGKTPVFYGGELTAPIAYKWKISWNETGKNVAFWNEYSEFNHNEFMGWTSHPVEKPFVIFDLISHFENPQILKRFEISDRLLSGLRPKANTIQLKGESLIAQLLWGSILADFASIYVAILNNVDPVPVALIEKLKTEL
jgi:glucose/mannose-6-phosphate isomerase